MNNRPIIKRRGKGRVGHDGNGMVGGSYAYAVQLHQAAVEFEPALACTESRDDAEEIFWWLYYYLNSDTVTVDAYFSVGYDHSVGIDSHCDLEEQFYSDAFDEAVDKCPMLSDDERASIKEKMTEIIDGLDASAYTPYEPDDDAEREQRRRER